MSNPPSLGKILNKKSFRFFSKFNNNLFNSFESQFVLKFLSAFLAPDFEKILFGSTIVGPRVTSLFFDCIIKALPKFVFI